MAGGESRGDSKGPCVEAWRHRLSASRAIVPRVRPVYPARLTITKAIPPAVCPSPRAHTAHRSPGWHGQGGAQRAAMAVPELTPAQQQQLPNYLKIAEAITMLALDPAPKVGGNRRAAK